MELIDMKKLDTAILYVHRIAEGNNPVNNMPVSDDTVLNNPNVIRCMYFVKDVLEEIKRNDGYIGRKTKNRKQEFSIELMNPFVYQEDKTITRFVEQLNENVNTTLYKKLSYKQIVDWLKMNNFLVKEYNDEFEKEVTYSTEKGKAIGILSSREQNSRGVDYIRVVYTRDAQEFIVNHMDKILNGEIYEYID